MKSEKKSGSITVEAVFLIPFIMITLIFFLWLSFYMHDKVVIEGTMQNVVCSAGDYIVYGTLAENGQLSKKRMEERGLTYAFRDSYPVEEERMENYFRLMLSGQLFLYRLNTVKFQKKGCHLTLKAEFTCSGFTPLSFFFPKGFVRTFEEQCLCIVREELTRLGSAALSILE